MNVSHPVHTTKGSRQDEQYRHCGAKRELEGTAQGKHADRQWLINSHPGRQVPRARCELGSGTNIPRRWSDHPYCPPCLLLVFPPCK